MKIKVRCPECRSDDIEIYEEKLSESGELYYVKIYKCYNCEAEFDEEESRKEK